MTRAEKLLKDAKTKRAIDFLQAARILMSDVAELDMDDPDPIGICMAIDEVGENLENMIEDRDDR